MLLDKQYLYRDGGLCCEGVNLAALAAQYGTPTFVYSRASIEASYRAYDCGLQDMPHQICYAVKANANLCVLQLLVRLGAGFDIVSGGELYRVLRAGADPDKVVFSGVGKTEQEMRYALEQGIQMFNCESGEEVERLSQVAAKAGKTASIALRVNPDVDAVTHPYISTGLREHKFGIDITCAEDLYIHASKLPGLNVTGVSCHIGSQLLNAGPILDAADKVLVLVERLRSRKIAIHHVDLGGGLGVPYRPGDDPPAVGPFLAALKKRLDGRSLKLFLEPGRSIVAGGGILLTEVVLVKHNGSKTFVVVDAAMNDLLRPTLYQAHHEIVPVRLGTTQRSIEADIVGPVCESGDFLARNRTIPEVTAGDLLAIQTAGAYGFALASNYNSRPRAAELVVDGTSVVEARRRETWEDLTRGEHLDEHFHAKAIENRG